MTTKSKSSTNASPSSCHKCSNLMRPQSFSTPCCPATSRTVRGGLVTSKHAVRPPKNAKKNLIIVIDNCGNIATCFGDHKIKNTVADMMLYHEARSWTPWLLPPSRKVTRYTLPHSHTANQTSLSYHRNTHIIETKMWTQDIFGIFPTANQFFLHG